MPLRSYFENTTIFGQIEYERGPAIKLNQQIRQIGNLLVNMYTKLIF